jgi:hypothetical protein
MLQALFIFWANVLLGNYPSGPISSGQMSFWANVFWENVVLGKCLWANLVRTNVVKPIKTNLRNILKKNLITNYGKMGPSPRYADSRTV